VSDRASSRGPAGTPRAVLEVTASAGAEAAALADEQLRGEIAASEKTWQLQVERAEYEARRTERQYMAVEPENRTVARELERRWEKRLEELEAVRAKATSALEYRRPLSEDELVRAAQLGGDLEQVWAAPSTTLRDRKRLLRCLIEEVQLRSQEKRDQVLIVWKGGATTQRDVPRFAPGGQACTTSLDTVELVRKLALEFDDAQIARILNRQGRRSGLGLAFTKQSVTSMRGTNKIPMAPRPRPRDEWEGPFTLDQAARKLGGTAGTVRRWLNQGLLAGRQAAPGAPWQIVLNDEVRQRSQGVMPRRDGSA
jgi:hypothetical protein